MSTTRKPKAPATTAPARARKMGQHTGYHTDGARFWLAPAYATAFSRLSDRRRALDELMQSISRYHTSATEDVVRASREEWDRLLDDLGLTRDQGQWVYRDSDNSIAIKEPDPS